MRAAPIALLTPLLFSFWPGRSMAGEAMTGPTIAVGAATATSGKVKVPVYAMGDAAQAYDGFSLHLRWNAALFRLDSAEATGGVFDPSASPAAGFCPAANTARFDGDGGGVVFACAGFKPANTVTQLLATFTLMPVKAGAVQCSVLHLLSLGGTDAGDTDRGTYTVEADSHEPQQNRLVDGTSSSAGTTCTPSAGTEAAGPVAPAATTNCIYDLNGDGSVNVLDLGILAAAYPSQPGDPKWNLLADLNVDGRVNPLDLNLLAANYLQSISYCADFGEYPYYPPGGWNGTLPSGYGWTKYLLFTGAIKYLGAPSEPCAWAFVSISTGADLNMCTAAISLAALGTSIANANPGSINQVFLGPNDCTALDVPEKTIADAAGRLSSLISYANANTPSNVLFYAVMDAEGYVLDDQGFCGKSDPLHIFDAITFFQAYRATGHTIGPAGALPYSAGDQQALSQNGGGVAIPQVYNLNNAQGAWPVTIAYGYAAIQTWPGGGYFNSSTAEWNWYLYHPAQHAPVDFNWTCPGSRC